MAAILSLRRVYICNKPLSIMSAFMLRDNAGQNCKVALGLGGGPHQKGVTGKEGVGISVPPHLRGGVVMGLNY